ncbi:uncharacterized protein CLUP02_06547 [Colletotrichum lupini]|uniref:Uncharacterized protein n=1 Tax=Colletotrichum lupini TaxID=145971 RepID=A0A9Q8SPF8_9PEZI|nr:uncharacterized protein CLUP02_06547 [Colletotrichum lupini]UQC81061.1 hypothetical protein CLUP02_06547 [Colletotrichum lupini]
MDPTGACHWTPPDRQHRFIGAKCKSGAVLHSITRCTSQLSKLKCFGHNSPRDREPAKLVLASPSLGGLALGLALPDSLRPTLALLSPKLLPFTLHLQTCNAAGANPNQQRPNGQRLSLLSLFLAHYAAPETLPAALCTSALFLDSFGRKRTLRFHSTYTLRKLDKIPPGPANSIQPSQVFSPARRHSDSLCFHSSRSDPDLSFDPSINPCLAKTLYHLWDLGHPWEQKKTCGVVELRRVNDTFSTYIGSLRHTAYCYGGVDLSCAVASGRTLSSLSNITIFRFFTNHSTTPNLIHTRLPAITIETAAKVCNAQTRHKPFAAVSPLQLPFPGSPYLRCRTSHSWTAYLDFMLSLIHKSEHQTIDRNCPDSISPQCLSGMLLRSLITRRLTAQLDLTSTPPIQDTSQPASRIVASLLTTEHPCRMEPCPPLVPIQPRFWSQLPPLYDPALAESVVRHFKQVQNLDTHANTASIGIRSTLISRFGLFCARPSSSRPQSLTMMIDLEKTRFSEQQPVAGCSVSHHAWQHLGSPGSRRSTRSRSSTGKMLVLAGMAVQPCSSQCAATMCQAHASVSVPAPFYASHEGRKTHRHLWMAHTTLELTAHATGRQPTHDGSILYIIIPRTGPPRRCTQAEGSWPTVLHMRWLNRSEQKETAGCPLQLVLPSPTCSVLSAVNAPTFTTFSRRSEGSNDGHTTTGPEQHTHFLKVAVLRFEKQVVFYSLVPIIDSGKSQSNRCFRSLQQARRHGHNDTLEIPRQTGPQLAAPVRNASIVRTPEVHIGPSRHLSSHLFHLCPLKPAKRHLQLTTSRALEMSLFSASFPVTGTELAGFMGLDLPGHSFLLGLITRRKFGPLIMLTEVPRRPSIRVLQYAHEVKILRGLARPLSALSSLMPVLCTPYHTIRRQLSQENAVGWATLILFLREKLHTDTPETQRRPPPPPPSLTAVPSHDPQPRTQKRGGLLTNNPGSKSHTETGVPGTVVDEGVKRAQSASLSTPGTRGNVILGFDRLQGTEAQTGGAGFPSHPEVSCRPRVAAMLDDVFLHASDSATWRQPANPGTSYVNPSLSLLLITPSPPSLAHPITSHPSIASLLRKKTADSVEIRAIINQGTPEAPGIEADRPLFFAEEFNVFPSPFPPCLFSLTLSLLSGSYRLVRVAFLWLVHRISLLDFSCKPGIMRGRPLELNKLDPFSTPAIGGRWAKLYYAELHWNKRAIIVKAVQCATSAHTFATDCVLMNTPTISITGPYTLASSCSVNAGPPFPPFSQIITPGNAVACFGIQVIEITHAMPPQSAD